MKKYYIAILFIIIGVAAYFGGSYLTTQFINSRGTAADEVSDTATKQTRENISGQDNELTLSDSQGAVTVDTTLILEESSASGLVFEIVMNTHSVDLAQYDLAGIAQLAFSTGSGATENFTWEADSNDSHHMKGTLKWTGSIPKDTANIKLELKGIGEAPSRTFVWDQKEAIEQITTK